MERKSPKRAGKSICSRTLAVARANALTNKCHDTLAAIYNLSARQVRRKIDKVKELAGVECINELAHWFHAHGLGFTSESEKRDFLKRDDELRKAA